MGAYGYSAGMQTPLDIYRRFRIFRGLQDHQLRVAAVGKYVAGRMHPPVDTRLVVLVGLFHDMGNIIKANFSMPELYEPEGPEYWRKVKDEYIATRGADEHEATKAIGREIGLPEKVIAIIDAMRFSRTRWIVEEGSMEHKICKYADLRVGPFGVLPLRERLGEARTRYAGKTYDTGDVLTPAELERVEEVCGRLEETVCSAAAIEPEDITDASILPIVEELEAYEVA